MLEDFSLLERKVGSLTFSNPLVYGGGTLKTLGDVKEACKSDAAGLELGTITPLPRAGNTGTLFYAHYERGVLIYTLNALGMPNPGRVAVTEWAKDAISLAHESGKHIGVNIAGDWSRDIVEMVLWGIQQGFDWVTINAGCPNKYKEVDGTSVPESILSFDTEAVETLVKILEIEIGRGAHHVWWKPSPDNDTIGRFERHARIISESSVINGWIANNTVPHCYSFEPEYGHATITPGEGRAGMGGPAVKPKALGDLHRLAQILPPHFIRIGAGGVTYGSDVKHFLTKGAHIVQFTSALWARNMRHDTANVILAELCELPGITQFFKRHKFLSERK